MREFVRHDGAFAAPDLPALRDQALASEYVGKSPLMGTFQASRGFAITFTSDGREEFPKRFPYFVPFVERALAHDSYRGLWSLRERAVHWLADLRPNAFFLNLLLVPPGRGVGPHIDATLQSRVGHEIFPQVVSVLYLSVPSPATGGTLRLTREGREVADITPQEGTLLHFRGDLTHEVRRVDDEADGTRASLVCEQYCVAESTLERLPRFAVKSQGRFQRLLEASKGRVPPGVWELDP